jgi:hypothetical protein
MGLSVFHKMLPQIILPMAFLGGVGALRITEHDKLAAQGLANVASDLKRHGYPKPGTCTPENTAVRREWFVPRTIASRALTET